MKLNYCSKGEKSPLTQYLAVKTAVETFSLFTIFTIL